MNKLTGRKFFLSFVGLIMVFVIAQEVIIPCMVSGEWTSAFTLLPGILLALTGLIAAFVGLQVIQEYNISKNYQPNLAEKKDEPEKNA